MKKLECLELDGGGGGEGGSTEKTGEGKVNSTAEKSKLRIYQQKTAANADGSTHRGQGLFP